MKKIYLFAMLFCAIQLFAGHSAVLRVKTNSGKTFEIEKIMDSSNEGASIKISKDWLAAADVAVLEVVPDFAKAKAGEDGYYVFLTGCGKVRLSQKWRIRSKPFAYGAFWNENSLLGFCCNNKKRQVESSIAAKS
ncbi:MAG: hypothetical protein ACLUKN_02145 [Bacilli bacterium]